MEILSNTQNNKATTNSTSNTNYTEIQKLIDLKKFMDNTLATNDYIARSEYKNKLLAEMEIIQNFENLKKMNCLETFCINNRISLDDIENILVQYYSFDTLIESHNERYIHHTLYEEKSYLDELLYEVDPQIVLDEDQRRVILTDEDYCLVIAGAGAGKTTTIAAKVKYLVEKKNIEPSQILIVSFTKNSVGELYKKLNKILAINCEIKTFHKKGKDILTKLTSEKRKIVDSLDFESVLTEYFNAYILKNDSLVNNLIIFFSSYFDVSYEDKNFENLFNEINDSDLTTLQRKLNKCEHQIYNIDKNKKLSICSEVMRSKQEVEIANFLYRNNIEYTYEPIYKYNIPESNKPYTPDFIIWQGDKFAYIEHFGITEDGKNDYFSNEELAKYKKEINDKITHHKKHGTTLIYTYSKYSDGRSLLEHLKEELYSIGFEINPRSDKEVLEKIIKNHKNRYVKKLIDLILRFIENFKTNSYTRDKFNEMYDSSNNTRTKLFLKICECCYLEYERYLKENNGIDFADIINEAEIILHNSKNIKYDFDYKYIIIDEYQDISQQKFNFVTTLSEICNAKIIAVGDDWQSIYSFNGSDITLFTEFENSLKKGLRKPNVYFKQFKLSKTYRNPQEIIDIASSFIKKNKTQISKEISSSKNIVNPIIIYTYDSSSSYAIAQAVEAALEQIIEFNKQENTPEDSPILLLGRFNNDSDKLTNSNLFESISNNKNNKKIKSKKYPQLELTYMTAHASKGLGFDNVIVINGRNETYGFPAKIEDDPVLSLVIKQERSIDHPEERRLFYVAMTRTKNRVYFVAPEQNPSEFLLEIKPDYKQDYENVVLHGNWNVDSYQNNNKKMYCPICGYPLQTRYKDTIGHKLYICTNDFEICGFMTNDYNAGVLSILKCQKCTDGYLIVKKTKTKNSDYFLGCTNYKKDGTGCNNTMCKLQYIIEYMPPEKLFN